MHRNILSKEQEALLPLVMRFRREFYLVGGTAIALHIGHRYSIDFDLFKRSPLRKSDIRKKLQQSGMTSVTGFENWEQLNLIVNEVKVTFYSFPYDVPAGCDFDKVIRMPDLLTLAAMKAFALGRRAKWKDYVDLYFILKHHHPLTEIAAKAGSIFKQDFSEKLFRMQLGYFERMDYREEVVYAIPNPPADEAIKEFLIAECVRL